jgi:hypothetical protein
MAVSRHTIVDRAADKASVSVGGTARWSGVPIAVGSPAHFLGFLIAQVADQMFDSGDAAAAWPSAGSPYASSMVRSKA